ncbi:type I restriction enzyme S subunit [Acidovorax sp. 94]|nr:type I restriction enzyme S subunit [Acidovorax sp. 94]
MSGVGKPGYKETAVGWIPVEWTLGKLGDFVAALQAGVSVNANETETGCLDGQVGVLKTSAVLGGKFFAHQHKVVVPEDVDRVASPILADRVVISRMNTPALVGESGYVPTAQPHLFLPDRLWQTVPSDCPHSQRWLSYWLQLPAIKSLIAAGATGTSNSMKNISKDVLLTLPTPHTPFPEQQKIAAILTAVDDKLDLIARQISATQALKQGLMQTLFTRGAGTPDAQGRWHPHTEFQDTELGRIPVGWRVTTLEQVANVERGKFSARPRNDPQYFEAGDIPFIQTGDIAGATRYVSQSSQFINEAGLTVSRLFPVGTIFITIAANIGDVAMAKIPMACPDSLVGILPSSAECDGMWLYYLLKNSKEYFDSQSTQNAQKNINLQVLRPFAFGLPPLAEQAHIAGSLGSIDDKLEVLTTQQAHYQSLKRGLMQKLLTGQWRVQVDAAAQATAHEEAPA